MLAGIIIIAFTAQDCALVPPHYHIHQLHERVLCSLLHMQMENRFHSRTELSSTFILESWERQRHRERGRGRQRQLCNVSHSHSNGNSQTNFVWENIHALLHYRAKPLCKGSPGARAGSQSWPQKPLGDIKKEKMGFTREGGGAKVKHQTSLSANKSQ